MVKKGATAPQVTDLWPIVEQTMKKRKISAPIGQRMSMCMNAKVVRRTEMDPITSGEMAAHMKYHAMLRYYLSA